MKKLSEFKFEDIIVGMNVMQNNFKGKIDSVMYDQKQYCVCIEWQDGTLSFPSISSCIDIFVL